MKRTLIFVFVFATKIGLAQFDSNHKIITSSINEFRSMQIGDLDGDGDNDMLMAIDSNDELVWVENLNGAGSFGPQSLIVDGLGSDGRYDIGDVDGDGDMDILFEDGINDQLKVAINDGAASFSIAVVDSFYTTAASTVRIMNVAGSDVNEVTVATQVDHGNVTLHWYAYNAGVWSDVDSLFSFSTSNDPTFLNPQMADMDMDGMDDLLFSHTDGNRMVIYRRVSNNPVVWDSPFQRFGFLEDYRIVDVDGDGDLDITVSDTDRIAWIENFSSQGSLSMSGFNELFDLSATTIQVALVEELGCGPGTEVVWSDENTDPWENIPVKWSNYSTDIESLQSHDTLFDVFERGYILDMVDLDSDTKPDLIMSRGDSLFFYSNDLSDIAVPTPTYASIDSVHGDSLFLLIAGTPAGGTYTGANVSNGVFQGLHVGAHEIRYTIEQASGCKATTSAEILVTAGTAAGNPINDFGNGGHLLIEEQALGMEEAVQLCDGRFLTIFHQSLHISYMKAFHQDLTVDHSWGINGVLMFNEYATTIQEDGTGRFLVSLKDYRNEDHEDWIVAVLPNGQIDTSFADNGYMNTYHHSFSAQNGELLVGGSTITKYDLQGVVDSSFADNGVLALHPGFPGNGGFLYSYRFEHLRHLPNGRFFSYITREKIPLTPSSPSFASWGRVYNESDLTYIEHYAAGSSHNGVWPQGEDFSMLNDNMFVYFFSFPAGFGYSPRVLDLSDYSLMNSTEFLPSEFLQMKDVDGCKDQQDNFVFSTTDENFFNPTLGMFRILSDSAAADSSWGGDAFIDTPYFGEPFCQDDGSILFLGWKEDTLRLSSYINLPDPQKQLDLTVLLGGPYDIGTGLMSDDLMQQDVLPMEDPCASVQQIECAAQLTDTLASGADGIVDWIKIEFIDALDSNTVRGAASGVVRRDGSVTNAGNNSPLDIVLPDGDYFVKVSHRNHLAVMSAQVITIDQPLTTIDLTNGSTLTFGIGGQQNNGGVYMMWAGDVNGDGHIKYAGSSNDRDQVLVAIGGNVPTNTVSGIYANQDANLDGNIKYTGPSNDRDVILVNIGGNVPTNTRSEQVP